MAEKISGLGIWWPEKEDTVFVSHQTCLPNWYYVCQQPTQYWGPEINEFEKLGLAWVVKAG